MFLEAAKAQWICPRLPSCGSGFESQAHHRSYDIVKFYAVLVNVLRKGQKYQKRGSFKNIYLMVCFQP